MDAHLILASSSDTRRQMLENAGLRIMAFAPRVDEDTMKASLAAEGASPRDIADALAEAKARKVAFRHPGALVLGCDQVLDHRGAALSKPETPADAIAQLHLLRGDRHALLSAAVLYEDGQPVWRHVATARLRMRPASDAYIEDYVARHWDSIRHSVGGYKLEEEGVRLITSIEGDYFTILGLPLVELLNHLILRGTLPS